MASSTGFTSRIYELVGAVFAVCASLSIESHGFSKFLDDPWYPWMYMLALAATFLMAIRAKSKLKNRWAEQVRTTFFFVAIIFISIALPNDAARISTVLFAIAHLFIPTLSPRNQE